MFKIPQIGLTDHEKLLISRQNDHSKIFGYFHEGSNFLLHQDISDIISKIKIIRSPVRKRIRNLK